MKYHLVSVDDRNSVWQVHKLNCADVTRMVRQRRCNAANAVEAVSPEALIKHELNENLVEMGFNSADFRVMPCCREAQ